MKPKKPAAPERPSKGAASAAPSQTPPLFRRVDWFTALATFLSVWSVYFITLAPEVTLEDAGELITGSVYAGIPHPPGYPVWTLYSWLFTVLVPVGNFAWRVALAQATAGAAACGLLCLLVSRGSALLINGTEALRELSAAWERSICIVAGVASGLLLGLDAFMWRESVAANRMAVASVPWFLLVLVCLFRWLYAPRDRRYLYWSLFLFGLCFTTHQSLIVAALGIEVLIAAANPRLGRDVFLGNSLIYLLYNLSLWVTGHHLFHNLGARPGLLMLFNLVGVSSMVAAVWLAVRTRGLLTEWKPVLIMGSLWLLGASVYLYLPLSGMTNPPMQWCYPRTLDGFIHALTRGQYEQPNPINVLADPGRFLGQLGMLISGDADSFTWVLLLVALVPFCFLRRFKPPQRAWVLGLAALYFCLGVLLMILLNPTPERGSADLVKVFFNNSHTLIAALIGYGFALLAAFMATRYQLFRPWGIAGGAIALLLALYEFGDSIAHHYLGPEGRIALRDLPHWVARAFAPQQDGLPVFAGLLLFGLAFVFLGALVLRRRQGPVGLALAIFAALPLYSGLAHWRQCDQRDHWFGYWFGHDMFSPPFAGSDGKPIFPPMTRDAILFGGTDPGRFCPTYMVFCESATPPRCQPKQDQSFDRRDVYVITQNALADPPYLNYIRAHYQRSEQIDPPFFSELLRAVAKDQEYQTNLLAKAVAPLDRAAASVGAAVEKGRRCGTSWFTEPDFANAASFAARLAPSPGQDLLSKFVYENLSSRTQKLVCARQDSKALRRCLARDLNHLVDRDLQINHQLASLRAEAAELDDQLAGATPTARQLFKQEELRTQISHLEAADPLYRPDRFEKIPLSPDLADFLKQNPRGHSRVRLNRRLLEAAYPSEIAHSRAGVYPDREIYTPSIEDQQRAFQIYATDAKRRMDLNQLRPGEDIKVEGGQIQVGGMTAVMSLNALLARVIFDRNPNHEFYVEESVPLEWMFPHLSPHGVIMKVNREPLPSLTEEMLQKDHEFWKQYSHRLTGEIADYDTPVATVAKWTTRTYLQNDFNGFTGDRKFVYDLDAQKSFAKLRTAIAGVYAWRLSPQCPEAYRPRTTEEAQRLFREANFAFLQAFSFSPWSQETVDRYTRFLIQSNRINDALVVADTCLQFDPKDAYVQAMADQLRHYLNQVSALVPPR